jgi:raffinose/stachyose/melibiose transport system permease protein
MSYIIDDTDTEAAARTSARSAGPQVGRRRRRMGAAQRAILAGFIAPGFILFGMFVIYPLLSGIRFSLYNWTGTGPLNDFVGLGNYVYTLFDAQFSQEFWRAVGHNFYFFAISMVITLFMGIGLAYLLMIIKEKASQRYTVIFMLPFTLPPVAVAYIWAIYLEPNNGVISNILTFLHLEALDLPFLGSPSLALPTIAVITAWVGMGFPVLVFMAAMMDVPTELLEAATLDGAGKFRTLWSVLLPAIRPTILTITTMNFIGAFSTFDFIYILEGSQAGPNYSTDVLATLFYRTGFGGFGTTAQSMGLASALAVLGFLIVMFFSAIFIRLQRRFQD